MVVTSWISCFYKFLLHTPYEISLFSFIRSLLCVFFFLTTFVAFLFIFICTVKKMKTYFILKILNFLCFSFL
jgi:hypothetical protein